MLSSADRPQAHLDDLLERIRFPLLDPKFVSSLDAHPLASRSARLPKLMLTALKFAVRAAPGGGAGVPWTGVHAWFCSRSCAKREDRPIAQCCTLKKP